MRKIWREMNKRMRSKDKLGFARKHFASLVSGSQCYSLRKRERVRKFNIQITEFKFTVWRRSSLILALLLPKAAY